MQWEIANRIEQINAESGFIQSVDEITLTANTAGSPVAYRARETDFLWTAAVAVSTGTFRLRIFAEYEGEYLDNGPVRSENFWGTAQLPNRHPPKFIPLNGQLTFEFFDTSGDGNTVALYLWGMRAKVCKTRPEACVGRDCCDRGRWGKGRGLFILAPPVNATTPAQDGFTVPANGPFSGSVHVQDAYHLRVAQINASATSALWRGNLYRIDPRDERNAYISNAQMRSAGWTGTSTAPGRPPSSLVLHKGSDVNYEFTDLSGATNYIRPTLVCERLNDKLVAVNG
jgi:hypothetical protein